MKKIQTAILAGVAGMAMMSTAALAEGAYFSFGAGFSLPQDSQVDIRRPPGAGVPGGFAAVNTEVTFDTGYILSGALGYKWNSGPRTEFEVNFRESGINDVAGAGATGRQKVLGFMGNVLFDFGDMDSTRPYVGGGLGIGRTKWSNVQGGRSATYLAGTPVFNDKDTNLQWQAIAGLAHPVGTATDMFVEYRYIGTFRNKFASVPAGSFASRHNDRSHNLLVGVRFNFGSEPTAVAETTTVAAAPPPPPPPPPAPPPPPPVPQKFLVFFDFDRSTIRTDASRIIAEAADYAKKNNRVRITATGHADTSGTPAYNLALSERRANAVKAELARLGFRENEVVVMFKGEAEPLVATGDGVKEPQNRRVEIVME
jgi:outer membrane protein OmpA-like peptidoglycan-associated protein